MLHELALTTSGSAQDDTTYAWDVRTGTILTTFKQSGFLGHTLAPFKAPGYPLSCSGFMGAIPGRPMVHCYVWNKDQAFLKFPCPEKLSALVLSYSGQWAVGGTPTGRLYLWETSSGQLLRYWDAHYKAVTTIQFARDDTFLMTGSEDAVVSMWELPEILEPLGYDLDPNQPMGLTKQPPMDQAPSARYTWTDHTLPVTAVVCGFGLGPYTRTLTASRDRTCKLWDHTTGHLLTTFVFPVAITSIVLTSTETAFYAGGADGSIWQIDLFRRGSRDTTGVANLSDLANTCEAVGGEQRIIDVASDNQQTAPDSESAWPVMVGHSDAITGLQLTMDGTLLVSASADERCIVWDVFSRQQLRTFTQHKGPVSNLAVLLRPPELVGLNMGASAQTSRRVPCIQPFKRVMQDTSLTATITNEPIPQPPKDNGVETPATTATTAPTAVITTGPVTHLVDRRSDLKRQLGALEFDDHSSVGRILAQAHHRGLNSQSGGSSAQVGQEMDKLKKELAGSREHIVRLRQINQDLHNFHVDYFLAQRTDPTTDE